MIDPASASLWLAKNIALPLLMSKVRGRLEARWEKRLAQNVTQFVDFPVKRRALIRWLKQPDNANLLFEGTAESIENAQESLAKHLRRHSATAESEAAELIYLILGQLLVHLPTATSVAVSHYQTTRKIDDLVAALHELDLGQTPPKPVLPPNVQAYYETALQEDRPNAIRLMRAVINDVVDRSTSIRQLLSEHPEWLKGAGASVWILAGSLAEAYACRGEAVVAYERAAELGAPDRVKWLSLAATHVPREEVETLHTLLERARGIDPSDPLLLTIEAIASDASAEVLESIDPSALPDEKRGLVLIFQADGLLQMNRLDSALPRLEEALPLLPHRSGVRVLAARAYLMRAQIGGGHSREHDLQRARDLALEARDLRRSWSAPQIGEATAVAIRAAVMAGDFVGALKLAVEPPEGEATADEANYEEVAELALNCALVLRRADLLERLSDAARSEAEKLLARALASERESGCSEETTALYLQAYKAATDADQRFAALHGLAGCGIWPIEGLEDFVKEFPEQGDIVIAVSEMERGLTESAIERLRGRSSSSRPAAATLAQVYEAAGEFDLAATTWTEIYSKFRDESALIEAAGVEFRAGRLSSSKELLNQAMSVLPARSPSRLKARRMLLELATDLSDWKEVENLARSLISDHGEEPQALWALIFALHNLGRLREAAETLDGSQLEPRNVTEASVWLSLKGRFSRSESDVLDVMRVARRFEEDEQVLGQAILAIIKIEQRAELSEGVVLETQQLTSLFLEKFPESQIFRAIPADDLDQVLSTIRAQLRPQDEGQLAVREAISEGRAPLGLLALNAQRPYAEAVIRRAAGFMVIGDVGQEADRWERSSFNAAIGQSVVVDTSALHSLTLVSNDVSDLLRRTFASIYVPSVALLDAHEASSSLSMRSKGTFVWDPEIADVRLVEVSDEELDLLSSRAQSLVHLAESFTTHDWTKVRSLKELEDLSEDLPQPWVAALDMAKTKQVPLYCDDVALRSLARSLDIPNFGTLVLLDMLVERRVLLEEARSAARLTLRRNWAVDMAPIAEEILAVASQADFAAGAAGAQFLRTAYWSDIDVALPIYRLVIGSVAHHAPDELPSWISQAAVGFIKSATGIHGHDAAGRLGAITAMTLDFHPSHFFKVLEGLRRAVAHLGFPDPLDDCCRTLIKILHKQLGADLGSQRYAALVSRLLPDDRSRAIEILLKP